MANIGLPGFEDTAPADPQGSGDAAIARKTQALRRATRGSQGRSRSGVSQGGAGGGPGPGPRGAAGRVSHWPFRAQGGRGAGAGLDTDQESTQSGEGTAAPSESPPGQTQPSPRLWLFAESLQRLRPMLSHLTRGTRPPLPALCLVEGSKDGHNTVCASTHVHAHPDKSGLLPPPRQALPQPDPPAPQPFLFRHVWDSPQPSRAPPAGPGLQF